MKDDGGSGEVEIWEIQFEEIDSLSPLGDLVSTASIATEAFHQNLVTTKDLTIGIQ